MRIAVAVLFFLLWPLNAMAQQQWWIYMDIDDAELIEIGDIIPLPSTNKHAEAEGACSAGGGFRDQTRQASFANSLAEDVECLQRFFPAPSNWDNAAIIVCEE